MKNIKPVVLEQLAKDGVTKPPKYSGKRQAGRPKEKRLRKRSKFPDPSNSPIVCSRCGGRGHNIRGCKVDQATIDRRKEEEAKEISEEAAKEETKKESDENESSSDKSSEEAAEVEAKEESDEDESGPDESSSSA